MFKNVELNVNGAHSKDTIAIVVVSRGIVYDIVDKCVSLMCEYRQVSI